MVPYDVAALPAGFVVVKEEAHFRIVLQYLQRVGYVAHAVEHADGFRKRQLVAHGQERQVVEESLEHENASVPVLRSLDRGYERAAADLRPGAAQRVTPVVVHEPNCHDLHVGAAGERVRHLLAVAVQDLPGYASGLRIGNQLPVGEALPDIDYVDGRSGFLWLRMSVADLLVKGGIYAVDLRQDVHPFAAGASGKETHKVKGTASFARAEVEPYGSAGLDAERRGPLVPEWRVAHVPPVHPAVLAEVGEDVGDRSTMEMLLLYFRVACHFVLKNFKPCVK